MAMALLTGARYLRLVEIRGAPGRQEQGPHEGARAVQRYADRRRQEQGAHVDYNDSRALLEAREGRQRLIYWSARGVKNTGHVDFERAAGPSRSAWTYWSARGAKNTDPMSDSGSFECDQVRGWNGLHQKLRAGVAMLMLWRGAS